MNTSIKCLESYVNEFYKDDYCIGLIAELIDLTEPSRKINVVYRGQIINNEICSDLWFSTSESKLQASFFMDNEGTCCLFKINLHPNVKYLIVEDNLPYIDNEDEFEIIISGKGTFYLDSEYSNIGFKQLQEGYYETWYK